MMRRFLWAAVALFGLFPPLVSAQVRIPPEALVSHRQVDEVIRQGVQLENERRWGDALTHYENALKEHPDQPGLKSRLNLAKIHYDVARRYQDASYVSSIGKLSTDEATHLYREVLTKINMHYVDVPSWQKFMHQGMHHMEIATGEQAFLRRFALEVNAAQRRAFIDDMHRGFDRDPQNTEQLVAMADWVAKVTESHFQVPPSATLLEFTCAAMGALDTYSAYLTEEQLAEVFSQIEGNFVGLGIELKADSHSLLIVHVIPGGPAADAGIQPGDRIIEVDGKSTHDATTDKAADLLKGPEHSYVSLVMRTANGTRSLRLQRRHVEVPSIENVRMVDEQEGVGYLKLSSFQKSTNRELDQALWQLHRQGMKRLIVDVRGNPGGLLTASVEVADKFINRGTIVSTRGRNARENYDYKANAMGTWQVPLVVMIDENSASASEIFAAAIRDHQRGQIVGVKSYGKGSVQGIFPLSTSKVGVRLTTAKFFSPMGHPISLRGVQPTVPVQKLARPTDQGTLPVRNTSDQDLALRAAVEVARQQTSSP